jgi:hypothetical protein
MRKRSSNQESELCSLELGYNGPAAKNLNCAAWNLVKMERQGVTLPDILPVLPTLVPPVLWTPVPLTRGGIGGGAVKNRVRK